MSDETGIPSEDTPPTDVTADVTDTPRGTGEDQQAAERNWEARYKEAQAWATRVSQEKAQLEQQAALINDLQSEDPEARSRAFQALGLELAEEPQPSFEDDPTGVLASRLEALEQRYQQQEQQAKTDARIAQIEQHVEAQLGALEGLSDRAQKWIVDRSVAMPPTPEGMPDIKGAYEEWVADMVEEQKAWAQTKRAPRISQAGQAGTQALPDTAGHAERVQFALERLQNDS